MDKIVIGLILLTIFAIIVNIIPFFIKDKKRKRDR